MKERMNLLAYLKQEEAHAFGGWDFSYLNGRWADEELPWDYEQFVRKYLQPESKILDMGTGGGEFLLSLGHPYENTSVTEAYLPNVELCKRTLEPLGITVRQNFEDDKIPYEDGIFDVVLNRHESFDPAEVKRVLKPGGYFITQQVGGRNNFELSKRLLPGYELRLPDHDLTHNVQALEKEQFVVEAQYEKYPWLRFYDVGALVYFAKIIEWEFPEFSVERCFQELCAMEQDIKEKGYIEGIEHRFFILAKRG